MKKKKKKKKKKTMEGYKKTQQISDNDVLSFVWTNFYQGSCISLCNFRITLKSIGHFCDPSPGHSVTSRPNIGLL